MSRNHDPDVIENKLDMPNDVLTVDPSVQHPSDVIGGWGPMQRRIFTMLCIIYVIAAFQNMNIVFIAPKHDFVCVDRDPISRTSVNISNGCWINNSTKCSKFVYNTTQHTRTLVSEFDLVCDRSWMGSATQSMHQLGYLISGVALGFISDHYGRLMAAKIAITLDIIAGFGQAFAPSIHVYMFARIFVGIAAYGRFLCGYVLISEWVGPQMRGKMSVAYECGSFVGELTLPWVFYYVRDYFVIQTGLSSVEIVLLIFYVIFVYESPKWLLTHEKYDQAEKILLKAATEKGKFTESEVKRRVQLLKNYTMEEKAKLEKERKSQSTLIDVWKDPQLLKISLILYFSWWSQAFIGYGSFFNLGQMGGNLYTNVFISACAGGCGYSLTYYLMPRNKRQSLMIFGVCMKVVGLLGIFVCSFHDELVPGRLIFYFISGLFGPTTWLSRYAYTTETFPTTMRQVSLGTCSVFARIGSIVSPFIKELTIATHLSVSVAFFTIIAVINAILLILLPDTTDIQLPDNFLQTKTHIELELKRRRSSVGEGAIQQIQRKLSIK